MHSDLVAEYERRRPRYERLGLMMKALLAQLAADVGVVPLTIEARPKTLESFAEKIDRPSKEGKYRSVGDMTDLCGVRVVLYTLSDCAKITEAIEKNFTIDELNSVDKNDPIEDNRFGYASTHLVTSLKGERQELFEYRDFADLKCEIQVRTVLQHAWAALDWELRYKSAVEVPQELRRKLYRISALLEEADVSFSEVKMASSQLRLQYEQSLDRGDVDIPLNRDSLELFINTDVDVQKFLERCFELGMKRWPVVRKVEKPWTFLLNSLEASGVKTVGELRETIRDATDEQINFVKRLQDDPIVVSLGQFVLLRNIVLTTLSRTARMAVIEKVPSTGPSAKQEKDLHSAAEM